MLDPAASSLPRADLRIDVPLVLIPVHVTSPLGVSITGLKKESFRLFENGVEQKIATFANEDAPVSIGVLFDMSGSMKDKIKKSSDAAIELLKTANPEDEFFLIQFNDRPKLLIPFTKDVDEIRKELACSLAGRPDGSSGRHPHGTAPDERCALLPQSADHRLRWRRHPAVSTKHKSRKRCSKPMSRFMRWAFSIYPERCPAHAKNARVRGCSTTWRTNRRPLSVTSLDDLPTVCARIGEALRNQYLLGYTPSNPERDGKYRSVKVLVDSPDPTGEPQPPGVSRTDRVSCSRAAVASDFEESFPKIVDLLIGAAVSFSQPGKPPHWKLQRRYSIKVRSSDSPSKVASADSFGSWILRRTVGRSPSSRSSFDSASGQTSYKIEVRSSGSVSVQRSNVPSSVWGPPIISGSVSIPSGARRDASPAAKLRQIARRMPSERAEGISPRFRRPR